MSLLLADASSEAAVISSVIGGNTPFSVSVWFFSDSASKEQTLWAIGDTAGDSDSHDLQAAGDDAGDPINARSRDNTTRLAASTTGYAINKWQLGTGVWAATNDRRAFVNGGSKGLNTDTRTPDNLDETVIGRRSQLTQENYMSSKIAFPTIWDIDLTDDEAAALFYYHPFFIRPDHIIAHWDFNGLSALTDLVGGNTLTLENGSGITVDDNPPIILPRPQYIVSAPSVAPPAGFVHSQAVLVG